MRFACDKCHTKYSIGDDRVHGKILKIRCKTCNNIITVREETTGAHSYVPGQTASFQAAPTPMSVAAAAPVKPLARALDASFARQDGMFDGDDHTMISSGAAPSMPPPIPPTDDWFVSFDGEQEGPYSVEKAAERSRIEIARGKEAYGWKEGFDGWLPVTEIPEVARHLRPPAPPPRPPMPPIPSSPPRPPAPEPLASIAPARSVSPAASPANAIAAHASGPAISGSSALAVAPAMQPAEVAVPRPAEPTLRPVADATPAHPKADPAPSPRAEARPSIATGGETPTSIAAVETKPAAAPVTAEAKPPAPTPSLEKKPEPAKVEPPPEAKKAEPAPEPKAKADGAGGDGVAPKAEAAPAAVEAPAAKPIEPAKVEARPAEPKRDEKPVKTPPADDKPKAEATKLDEEPKAEAKKADEKPKADARPVEKKTDEKPKADDRPVEKKADEKPKADAKPVEKKADDKPKADAKPAPKAPAKAPADAKPADNKASPAKPAPKSTGDADLDLFISEPSILGQLPPDLAAPSQSVVIVAPGAAPGQAAWLKWAVLALGLVVVALGGTLVWVLVVKKPVVATVVAPAPETTGRAVENDPINIKTAAPAPGAPETAPPTVAPDKKPVPGQATKHVAKTVKSGPAAPGAPSLDALAAMQGDGPDRAPTDDIVERRVQSHNTGGDPTEQIGKLLTQNKKSLQSCYERVLKMGDPTLERARVDVTIQVGISGRPKKVSVPGRFTGTDLGDCLVKAISHWNFPSTGAEYETGFPLLLQASSN